MHLGILVRKKLDMKGVTFQVIDFIFWKLVLFIYHKHWRAQFTLNTCNYLIQHFRIITGTAGMKVQMTNHKGKENQN
jgi:hypothetical protein